MKYNPEIHHRRSTRLKGYDYSKSGAYFITICTKHNECRFGKIQNGKMFLNEAGKMVEKEWLDIPSKFPFIELDEFIVMPNHFHCIFFICDSNYRTNNNIGTTLVVAPVYNNEECITINSAQTVGDIIGAFKSITTNEYIKGVKNNIYPRFDRLLWHRNFHDHIIRNEKSLNNIRNYIINNPKKWNEDKFFNK